MRRPKLDPWFMRQDFKEFGQFGYTISGLAYADEVSIKIALQPGVTTDDSATECRRKIYEMAEQALALAAERYELRSYDLRITHPGSGYPMEPTLDISLAEKKEL